MTNKCLYYDKVLQKTIPCKLVPNKLYTVNGVRFCKITYDQTLFVDYNTNYDELFRYSTDMINIMSLYPANSQSEIDYAIECIPNKIAADHKNKELLRFEQLITMLVDVETIKTDFFYKLADLLSYDILFLYLNHQERVFMLTLCTYPITVQTLPGIMINGEVPMHPYLRSIKNIFDKYPEDNTVIYNIQNIRNLAEFSYITFPLQINVPLLKSNVLMLHNNNYLT